MDLPDEVTLNIMRFCTINTLGNLGSVCQNFNKLYRDDIIWKQKYVDICTFSERPHTWQKYPWYVNVKSMMIKKYNLRIYKGEYIDECNIILVSGHIDFEQFTLCQILGNPNIKLLPSNYLVQNVISIRFIIAGSYYYGQQAKTLSNLSNPTWWFNLYNRKITNKNLISIVET
ncbi:F-box-like domain protein [Pacmanvirus S19]|nr:F-box-like domain protein [Pacmanvirus S19]